MGTVLVHKLNSRAVWVGFNSYIIIVHIIDKSLCINNAVSLLSMVET